MHRSSTVTAPLILAAHGTRNAAGPREVERMAAAVRRRLRVPVHPAYVDVIGPSLAEVLNGVSGPAVVVPAFLARGYHVRHDLPRQLAAIGQRMIVTEPLGPTQAIADAMYERLVQAGWRRGDRVLLAAAGSSDSRALEDVRTATSMLSWRCRQRVTTSFVTTVPPRTADLCDDRRRTFIAPYLLAPGLFHSRLTELPVTATAGPLGTHPRVLELIEARYLCAYRDELRVA